MWMNGVCVRAGNSRHPSSLNPFQRCLSVCVRRLMNTENISMNILYVWDDTWKINCYCFACVPLSASVYVRTLFVFRLLFLFLLFGVCWYISIYKFVDDNVQPTHSFCRWFCFRWNTGTLNIIVNEYSFWCTATYGLLYFNCGPKCFALTWLLPSSWIRIWLIIIYYWYARFVCSLYSNATDMAFSFFCVTMLWPSDSNPTAIVYSQQALICIVPFAQ